MNNRDRFILLKTVQEDNILPVTSVCNMKCQFCSHQQNPASVEVFRFGHLDYNFIKELITYLPDSGPVIIGESASKIIEGEPFVHPDFKKILLQLRQQRPHKKIKITTNGSYLTRSMVEFLERLQPLELNISLNCADPEQRVFLMCDSQPDCVFKGFTYLQDTEIDFHGSVVAMPHLLGWKYLEDTVDLLCEYNCLTIRIFMPGFTKKAPAALKFSSDLFCRLRQFTEKINKKFKTPVILEPPLLSNFECKIKGVIRQTSAARAGIKQNDIIVKIDDYKPLTRVDAFNKVVESKSPELTIVRDGKWQRLQLEKAEGEKPGFVMDYDLSPDMISSLRKKIFNSKAKKVVIITSKLAGKLIDNVADKLTDEDKNIDLKVISVENKFFGGSIMSAGLLITDDIISALKKENIEKYDLIILPRIIYDIFGKDLTGKSYQEIGDYFDINVCLI